MTSLNSSVGSKSTYLPLPLAAVVNPCDAAFSFGGASRGAGGTRVGSSSGAICSSWISRLSPIPRRHGTLPTDQTDLTAPEARSAQVGTTVSTRESRTGPRLPSDDLDRSSFLVRRYLSLLRTNPTPPPRSFSSRLLRHEAPGAAISSSCHQPLPQSEQREEKQQHQEPQADLGHQGGAVAEHEQATARREGIRGRRDCRVAGFGPFQLSSKRARLPLGKGHKQHQEPSQWKLEGDHGGGCGTAPAGVAEKGSYKPYLGDGCFPIFQRIVGFAAVCEEGEVAEKDRKEEELHEEMRERGTP